MFLFRLLWRVIGPFLVPSFDFILWNPTQIFPIGSLQLEFPISSSLSGVKDFTYLELIVDRVLGKVLLI